MKQLRFDARGHLAAVDPLFPFRGPLGRPHPARRGDRHRAVASSRSRSSSTMVQSLLQHPAGSQLGRLRQRRRVFLRAGGDVYRARGLPALPQSVAADPLAALDDADLSAANGSTAPITTACSSSATPPTTRTSASPTTCHVRRVHADDRHRPAQFGGHAVLVRRHPVDAVGGGAADTVRPAQHSRLSGVGGSDLCGRRHHAHPPDRLAAHSAQFPAAAVRGGFPLQSGAHARERRADRRAARRSGGARAAPPPFQLRGRQLVRADAARRSSSPFSPRAIRRPR